MPALLSLPRRPTSRLLLGCLRTSAMYLIVESVVPTPALAPAPTLVLALI